MAMQETNKGLVQVAEELWAVEHHREMLGLHAQIRMSVVRLDGGGLLLYSPVPIDDDLAVALEALGPVAHIVAPSRFHHLFAGPAKERFPDAQLWASPGLADKRKDLAFDGELVPPSPFGPSVAMVYLAGNDLLSETVLFHKTSRSLLCCDFFFNVREESSLLSATLFRAMGVLGRPGQSRTWRLFTRDKARQREPVAEVLSWDVARIVMAHGDILEDDARAELQRATAWLSG